MADNDASEIDRREIILPTARFSDYAGVPTRLQKQVARFWRDRPNSFADRSGNFAGASVMRRSIVLPRPSAKVRGRLLNIFDALGIVHRAEPLNVEYAHYPIANKMVLTSKLPTTALTIC